VLEQADTAYGRNYFLYKGTETCLFITVFVMQNSVVTFCRELSTWV